MSRKPNSWFSLSSAKSWTISGKLSQTAPFVGDDGVRVVITQSWEMFVRWLGNEAPGPIIQL
jgi:hypothetical protein